MRISDWSSDVCSSDLVGIGAAFGLLARRVIEHDVVRIDEPDDLEPGLATRLVAPRIVENGARRIARDGYVGLVAVPRQPDFLAAEAVILEAEFLHRISGRRLDASGNARPVSFVVYGGEMKGT